MKILVIGGEFFLIVLILFFLFFSIYSLLEREKRAFWRSTFLLLLLLSADVILLFMDFSLKGWIFGAFFLAGLMIFIVLFFSAAPRKSMEIIGTQERIDERDIIFSRFDYKEGSDIFMEYYSRKPEYRKIDDEIRKLPDILTEPHINKYPFLFSLASAESDFIEHQVTKVSGIESLDKVKQTASENTRIVKKLIKYLGSDLCGICELDKSFVYSHVGRGPEVYGEEIKVEHKYAIVFAIEMDYKMIRCAPKAPVIVESENKYVEAARISIITASFLRKLGYSARAHTAGSNYQAMLDPIAWKAGLGELGRMGIIITEKYGPRARLGLVTTDIPLIKDKPIIMGVQDFCNKCKKCARNCPSKAIPYGEKEENNGVLRWVINREACYKYWRKVGTDCAVCISVCPYSKPNNLLYNIIRKLSKRSRAFQTLFIKGDDFFYGRFPQRENASPLGF